MTDSSLRKCITCGVSYQARRKDQVCCSAACSYKSPRSKDSVRRSKKKLGRVATSVESRRRWAATEYGRASSLRSRISHKYGIPLSEMELFTLTDVVARDGKCCRICGTLVDLTLVYTNRNAPHMDHKIPLSRGGGHVLDNAQLAHGICNVLKSDRVLPEVRVSQ